MRTVDRVPGLVPSFDVTVYLVLDHFGRLGSAYRETDEEHADLENVINNMLHGEYNNPKRVVAFNTAEKWSSDVSEDIAWEVLKRVSNQGPALPASMRSFCESMLDYGRVRWPKMPGFRSRLHTRQISVGGIGSMSGRSSGGSSAGDGVLIRLGSDSKTETEGKADQVKG
jgi:hypothetical protein